jgi:hypothetical protein
MNPGGLAQAIRKLRSGLEVWRNLNLHEIARRIGGSHPYAAFMFGARKLFFGVLFLVVVAMMLYFLSLR